MKLCILARKDLERNTRVVRQARALRQAGHQVTVVCIKRPIPEMYEQALGARFVEVADPPLVAKLFPDRQSGQTATKEKQGPAQASSPGAAKKALMSAAVFMLAPLNPKAFRNRRKASSDYELLRMYLSPYYGIFTARRFAAQAERLLAGERFDIYQAHDSHALAAAWRLARRNRAKFIYDVLEINLDRSSSTAAARPALVRWFEPWNEKRLAGHADSLMAVGPFVAQHAARQFGKPAPLILRNCCMYQKPEPNDDLKQALGLDSQNKVALVLGAIYINQGLEQLIEAAQLLNPGIHIAALGPVSQQGYDDRLGELARAKGVQDCFHILPPVPQHQLQHFASGADVGLIARQAASLNNKFCLPNKLFEMISCRLPILCGGLPDIQDILKQYSIGLSFNEKDPADMARALNMIFEDQALLKGLRKAADRAANELSWENESRKYVRFVEDLV